MQRAEHLSKFALLTIEGEGYKVEFKEKPSGLDREIVAFANSAGGSIYLGIDDRGEIKKLEISNALKSQVQDIAYNCDPSVQVTLVPYPKEGILEVQVAEGTDKPYRCREGFFMRNGPSTQKLRRNEILDLLTQRVHFDELLNPKFSFPADFSEDYFKQFLSLSKIQVNASPEDILLSLSAAQESSGQLLLTNAAILFFAKEPQRFFRESYITCVRYKTADRFSILDKKDFIGGLISQIDQSLQFVERHIMTGFDLGKQTFARHDELNEYPFLALREAIINAVTHRDYLYDSSHIYVHIFSNRIEIENPGGLCYGLTIDHLGQRSVRRNRLVADLLHRAGYIERVGSGFSRMEHALLENHNPPLEVSASNFFNIRFYPRVMQERVPSLSARQMQLYQLFQEKATLTQKELTHALHISADTVIRDLKVLMEHGLILQEGIGKATTYKKGQ